jgi:D-arabinose 1-dehydrogenase-like Zn-dependent alcohol dehydrogenase
MRALQYTAIGKPPEIREVPRPEPGPGEVLIKVTAAGVCHSDEYFMGRSAEENTFELPMTLGHEGAGIVAALEPASGTRAWRGTPSLSTELGLRQLPAVRSRR